jgi:hypothetical protein
MIQNLLRGMRTSRRLGFTGLLAMGMTAMANAAGAAKLEDFRGFWQPVSKVTQLRTVNGQLPALTAKGKKFYDAAVASASGGDRWFDNELDCLPIGMTRLMAESPFELVVDEKLVALAFQWNRHVHVALRRDKHLSEYDYPAYLGYTIAYLRGGALQLDSTYFNDSTILDFSGLPHGEQLRVRQSLALRDANTLVVTMTITDPEYYAKAWQTRLTYNRMPADTLLKEDVCTERMGITKLDAHKRRDAGLKRLGLIKE